MSGDDSPRHTLPNIANTDSEELPETTFSKWQIIKNLIIICIGLVLFFTAYSGLSMLQSTINQEHGIGVASQAIIYAGFCLSALLLPKYTIKKLGCKYTLLISMIGYIPYIAANFYFNWFTMVPSAILVGLSASLLWSSQCTYFNEAAILYSIIVTGGICNSKVKDADKQTSNDATETKNNMNNSVGAEIKKRVKYETLDCNVLQKTCVKDELKCNVKILCSNNSEKIQNSTNIIQGKKIFADILPSDANCSKENALNPSDLSHSFGKIHNYCSSMTSTDTNCSKQNTLHLEASSDSSETARSQSCTILPTNTNFSEQNACDPKDLQHIVEYEQAYNSTIKLVASQSEEYSKVVSSVTARFFGAFGLAFRSSDIWSNLMSYYVLQDGQILDNITENGNCSCGASFCNVESNCFEHNLAEPSQQMRITLTGISVMLAVIAVILVFMFLDELEKDRKPISFSFDVAFATCKFAKDKQALLLIPFSAYIGLQQGFYIGDFTKSYIACAWGVYHVGLVTVSYGLFAGLSSTLAGFLVKYVGRIPVLMTGFIVNAGVNIFLLIWDPLPSQPELFFLGAAMWGVAIGILWSQLRAFYGVLFKEDTEAAFAGFYLWDSIGYCFAFSYSNYICTYMKLYILLAVSTLGLIGYLKTESLYAQKSKK